MTLSIRKRTLPLLLAIPFGLLHGCALDKPPTAAELASHAIPAPDDHRQWANGGTPGDPADGWLASFNDAELARLVREAMTHNGDLAIAAIRVQQAEAMVTEASSGLLPSAGAKGRAGEAESQILSVGVSWELDLWGRIRAQSRAAQSQHLASEADYAWAQRVVAAATAKAWFALIKCTQLESRLQQIVDVQAEIVRIEDRRVAIGAAPQTEAQQARNTLRVNQDALVKATLARNRAAQALELLLGRYPAGEMLAEPDMPALPEAPPAGLPANLIERRPDMVAASQRVAAAFDQRQSAQAARLPSVSIDAAITGIRSNVLTIMDSSSPVKGVSASFLAPIFTGGKLKAQADYYTEAQKEAMVAYDDSALQALSEVEAGLQAETRYAERVAQLQARVDESQSLLNKEEARAKIGSTDERSVLQDRQALLSAEMDLVEVRGDQLAQRIDLLLALGGDWQRTGT
ncbi:TolC family protein [Paraburkholderia silviterrae]|uniref:TolC family protein n=1 Tax=Paraburkholderia silviterrae TaxID=2528715 RepID=A0A4R5M8M4_9BURK|nr:TolC family protein [Paraburkholderia silviterrae]TDG22865.1 TolC family protein [Paraburkholderia silviterrae]